MTKKQTEVNDQNAENAAAAEAPVTTEEQTAAEAGEEAEEAEDVVNGEDTMNEALEPGEVDDSEPAPPPAAHGTHNAAVNGLQTSPGYDPSKL